MGMFRWRRYVLCHAQAAEQHMVMMRIWSSRWTRSRVKPKELYDTLMA